MNIRKVIIISGKAKEVFAKIHKLASENPNVTLGEYKMVKCENKKEETKNVE